MKVGRELAAFAAIGAIGFVVDVGVVYALAPHLGWYGARVLSFIAASSTTWLLNRSFTFRHRRAGVSLAREYLGYVASMLGGALVNYVVYVAVLHGMEGRWAPALGVALGSVSGLAINFLAARQLVFRSRRPR